MTELNELKKIWEDSGAAEDEVAYLDARLEQGDLSREKLEIAAYMLHEAALLVLGQKAEDHEDLGIWPKKLDRWGKEPVVRALYANAKAALMLFDQFDPAPIAEILKVVRLWLLDPTEATMDKVKELAGKTRLTTDNRNSEHSCCSSIYYMLALAAEANLLMADYYTGLLHAEIVWSCQLRPLNLGGTESQERARDKFKSVIIPAIVPWALGYSDPLLT